MSSFFLPNWSPPDDPARPLPAEGRPWPSDDDDDDDDDADDDDGGDQRSVEARLADSVTGVTIPPNGAKLCRKYASHTALHKYTNKQKHKYKKYTLLILLAKIHFGHCLHSTGSDDAQHIVPRSG